MRRRWMLLGGLLLVLGALVGYHRLSAPSGARVESSVTTHSGTALPAFTPQPFTAIAADYDLGVSAFPALPLVLVLTSPAAVQRQAAHFDPATLALVAAAAEQGEPLVAVFGSKAGNDGVTLRVTSLGPSADPLAGLPGTLVISATLQHPTGLAGQLLTVPYHIVRTPALADEQPMMLIINGMVVPATVIRD